MDKDSRKSLLYAKMAVVLILLMQIFIALIFWLWMEGYARVFGQIPREFPRKVMLVMNSYFNYGLIVHVLPLLISGVLVLLFFLNYKKQGYNYAKTVFFMVVSTTVQMLIGGYCILVVTRYLSYLSNR